MVGGGHARRIFIIIEFWSWLLEGHQHVGQIQTLSSFMGVIGTDYQEIGR